GERRLAGQHRVSVPPQGIDLAVVGEHAERLDERPTRRRVRRVALVEDRERRRVVRGLEVGKEAGELGAGEQRLVYERAARERAHEERLEAGPRLGDAAFDGPAREIERAFPRRVVVASAVRRGDDCLPDGGTGGVGTRAEDLQIHWYVAPPEHREALAAQHFLDDGGGAAEGVVPARQEEGTDGEWLPGRERQSAARRLTVEQRGGDLSEQPSAVAGAVGGRSAAVSDPGQRPQREARDIGGASSRRAGHEPHATSVVLPPGVEATRAGLGPTRSVGCGHRISCSRPVNRKGPLNWERAGEFALSRLRAYARRPLPSVGVAGFRMATAFSVQLCDMSEPPESINPKALIFTERHKYTRLFELVKGWARPDAAARRTGSTGRPSSRRCLARATPSPRGVRDRARPGPRGDRGSRVSRRGARARGWLGREGRQ